MASNTFDINLVVFKNYDLSGQTLLRSQQTWVETGQVLCATYVAYQ